MAIPIVPILFGAEALGLLVSLAAIARFSYRQHCSIASAPRLIHHHHSQQSTDKETLLASDPSPSTLHAPTSLSVIIPAYNEELNLQDCVKSILTSQLPPHLALEVWIADDESTDGTAAIVAELVALDSRVHGFTVPPRPNQNWRGKTWACTQAAERAIGDYLLFIDADVRLHPAAIAVALDHAQRHQADLLSCAPEIVCGCLAEWLVQPLIMGLLAVGFQFDALNDPTNPTAFAAGPFMLFRRAPYQHIGGHRAVAHEVVEDVELARRVKAAGLRLRYVLGLGLVQVRMYRSFAALWEGWTKNLYLGAQRNVAAMGLIAIAMVFLYVLPWWGLLTSLAIVFYAITFYPVVASPILPEFSLPWASALLLLLTLVTLGSQYWLRYRSAHLFQQPLRYWWLSWLGGSIVAAMAIVSIVKTETGWGWTWRGRSLAVKQP